MGGGGRSEAAASVPRASPASAGGFFEDQVAHGGVGGAGTWKKRCATRGLQPAGAPSAQSAIAPRAISHITSSMPSEPASRTYSMCGTLASSAGSAIRRSRNLLSQSALIRPARDALQLVAHAARAPDVDVQVFVVRLDGAADGAAPG